MRFFIAKEKGYSTQNYVTKKQLNSDKKINNANTEKSHKCVVWLEEKKGFEPSNDLHRYSISNYVSCIFNNSILYMNIVIQHTNII